MRILGVDPGTLRTGAGLIEAEGNRCRLIADEIIRCDAKQPMAARLFRIYQSLLALIQKYSPSVLALENVFYAKDAQAMVKIGGARACAMLAASEAGIEVVEYPPARVKQSVSGNGRATKEQIQYMVKKLLNLREAPGEDSADALAAAICHWHSCKKVHSPQTAVHRKFSADRGLLTAD